MNKMMINAICAFIYGKERRHNFREKHKDISLLEINKKIDDLFCLCERFDDRFNNLSKTILQDNKSNNSVRCLWNLSNVDWEQYEKDVENLKKGLDGDSLEILEDLLEKLEKTTFDSSIKETNLYSFESMREFAKMRSVSHRIKKIDCYQLDNYKLPSSNFEPSIFTKKWEIEKLKTVDILRKNNRAIFDIGAFIGDSTLLLRNMFKDNPIYAFEPIHYDSLLKTIELNNLKNVFPVEIGLGEKDEYMEIKYHYAKQVHVKTLDDFVKENNITVGLIKSDIEGMEMGLLKGAINTIREQKPILIISIYHNYNDFFKIKPMIEQLNLGYKFKISNASYGIYLIHEVTINCEVV